MTDVSCPECNHKFPVAPKALFADHTMTFKVEMQPGTMMQLEELGKMLTAIAKLSALSCKDAGAKKPMVGVKSFTTEADCITVEIVMMDFKR